MLEPSIISGLYVLTHHDHKTCEIMLSDVEAVLKGGARLIQYRDKNSEPKERLKRASKLLELCRAYKKPLIINDDIELCKKIDADGVHLGQKDLAVNFARKQLGNNKIIGATCHQSAAMALHAEKSGATYIALGSFFPSLSKPGASLAPLDCITHVRRSSSLPIVAIGGITLDNAPIFLEHEINALAVIHDVFYAKDIEARARQFAKLFNPC